MEIINSFEPKKRAKKTKRKISITKSISMREDMFKLIEQHCEEYFQGNLSACMGYMCKRYLEYQVIMEKVVERGRAPLPNYNYTETNTKEEKVIEETKVDQKIHRSNLDAMNNALGVG